MPTFHHITSLGLTFQGTIKLAKGIFGMSSTEQSRNCKTTGNKTNKRVNDNCSRNNVNEDVFLDDQCSICCCRFVCLHQF